MIGERAVVVMGEGATAAPGARAAAWGAAPGARVARVAASDSRRAGSGMRPAGVRPAGALRAARRLASAAALACVLAVAGAPCAWAAGADSSVGVRLGATPAEAEYETATGATGVGIRLTSVPDAEHYESASGATHVGVRLTATPRAAEYETQAGASAVGIRLAATPAASQYEAQAGSSHVGIRLVAEPAAAEYASAAGASAVGIRIKSVAVYTVYFDTGAGGPMPPQDVRRGECAADPGVPVRDGWGFTGWYASADAAAASDPDGRFVFEATPITDTTTVYAGWVERPVDVYFDANGGAWGGAEAGELNDDGTWSPECEYDGKTVKGAYPGTAYGDIKPSEPGRSAKHAAFAGWWTDDGRAEDGSADGEWGSRVTDADRVPGTGATLYARWIAERVSIEYAAGDGDGAEAWRHVLALGEDLPAAPEGAAVPAKAGYRVDGLWWRDAAGDAGGGSGDGAGSGGAITGAGSGSVGNVGGAGSADEAAAVEYYARDWEAGAWRPAEGAWDSPEHVTLDRYAWSDEAGGWVESAGGDGIPDTVVLAPRWALQVSATVPVSMAFAVSGTPDAAPTAVGPSPDAFAIRSRTAEAVTVEAVDAVGIADAEDAAELGGAPDSAGAGAAEGADAPAPKGLEDLFYTAGSGEGDERRLVYGSLGTDPAVAGDVEGIWLTLRSGKASGEAGAARLQVAGTSGVAGRDGRAPSTATAGGEAWACDPWPGTGDDAPLAIEFGLELNSKLRAFESATGAIARVTFTLSATQHNFW